MSDLSMYLMDTFTDKIFHGHPIAVCTLTEALNDELLLAIALENQFPETVFARLENKQWHIRWFNASGEIYGTGHGSIAVASVLFEQYRCQSNDMTLQGALGPIKIFREHERFYLEYPMTQVKMENAPDIVSQYFSIQPHEIWQSGPDIIAYFEQQDVVEHLTIQWDALKNIVSGAVICTAPSTETDIYTRCFLPRLGGVEETAMPAIYPRLMQFWQIKKPKNSYKGIQGLMRRSEIYFMRRDHYVWVGGNCRCYFQGELLL